MYLRNTTRRKDGKIHIYWQLVRSWQSCSRDGGPTWELDGEGRARAKALARSICGAGQDLYQGQLFDEGEPAKALAVKFDAVRLERSRSFCAVWLGWVLWRALKLDELLSELMAPKREKVSWAEVTAILVIGRLCEPLQRVARGRALVSQHRARKAARGFNRAHVRRLFVSRVGPGVGA